jgi:hypothetical protein
VAQEEQDLLAVDERGRAGPDVGEDDRSRRRGPFERGQHVGPDGGIRATAGFHRACRDGDARADDRVGVVRELAQARRAEPALPVGDPREAGAQEAGREQEGGE